MNITKEFDSLDSSCYTCGYLHPTKFYNFFKCYGTPRCPITKKNPALDNSV